MEQLFGILRLLRGGYLNFICLDLRDRIASVGLVQLTFSEFPKWDNKSRRLTSTINRKNTKSWEGDTLVKNLDVVEF